MTTSTPGINIQSSSETCTRNGGHHQILMMIDSIEDLYKNYCDSDDSEKKRGSDQLRASREPGEYEGNNTQYQCIWSVLRNEFFLYAWKLDQLHGGV